VIEYNNNTSTRRLEQQKRKRTQQGKGIAARKSIRDTQKEREVKTHTSHVVEGGQPVEMYLPYPNESPL